MASEELKTVSGVGGFPPDWKVLQANDVSIKVTKGTTPSKSDVSKSGDIPFLRVNNLSFNGVLDKTSDFIFVSEEAHNNFLARSRAYPGDVLMNIVGPPLGKTSLLGADFNEYNMNQAIVFYRLKNDVANAEFFLSYLNGFRAQNWLQSRSKKTSGQQNLTIEICKELPVPVPPLPEQKKIASILSTWNDAISANEDLLANSRQRKKALMQQLLTGKKRLPGFEEKWISASIAQFCKKESIRAGMDDSYPVLSCTKYDGFVDSLDYFNKQVFSDDTSNYKVIKRDWIGFPSNHVEEGSIGIQNLYQAGIVSPIYEIFSVDNSKCLPDYLYANLKSDMYRQIFASRTNASVDRRGSLRWDTFSQIDVLLPPVDEQECIVDIITTSAKEIETLEQRINNLKLQKKALMQQLLTGKKRVVVEKEVA